MNADEMSDPHAVRTRHDLSEFVDRMAEELREHPGRWENVTLGAFLQALARYLVDLDGYCRNMAPEIDPDRPDWRTFAIALAGAAVYE